MNALQRWASKDRRPLSALLLWLCGCLFGAAFVSHFGPAGTLAALLAAQLLTVRACAVVDAREPARR